MKTVICIDKDNNQHVISISELIWRPSAYGIIIKDDHILLSCQYDGYDLPGGGIDLGETIDEGLIREVKEETGMDIEVGELVEYKVNFFKPTHSQDRYYESICFYHKCTITEGELSIDGLNEDEKKYMKLAKWVPLSEIESIKFYSSIQLIPIIQKAIQQ